MHIYLIHAMLDLHGINFQRAISSFHYCLLFWFSHRECAKVKDIHGTWTISKLMKETTSFKLISVFSIWTAYQLLESV
jgi:hypothetical protein